MIRTRVGCCPWFTPSIPSRKRLQYIRFQLVSEFADNQDAGATLPSNLAVCQGAALPTMATWSSYSSILASQRKRKRHTRFQLVSELRIISCLRDTPPFSHRCQVAELNRDLDLNGLRASPSA